MLQLIIIQCISVLINTYIAFTKNIKRIFIVTFLFNLSLLILYIVNKDMTTIAMYVIITIRSFIYIYKDKIQEKTNCVPWIAITLQIMLGAITIKNPWQLISIITPCYSCWYLWYSNDTQDLRIGNIIANSLWGLYNGITGLFIVMAMRIVTVIVNIVAYCRHRHNIEE